MPCREYLQRRDKIRRCSRNCASGYLVRGSATQAVIAEAPQSRRNTLGEIAEITSGEDCERSAHTFSTGDEHVFHSGNKADGVCVILQTGQCAIEIKEQGIVRRQHNVSVGCYSHTLH
jgi:hypothetical protein